MRTRDQLIARVLKDLGVLAAGQAPSDEDRAEVDDLIEPVCAKLLDDEVAKVNGDEIDDAVYLALAAIVAEAALVPFGIAGQKATDLAAAGERARTDLKLAYRVYTARRPLRTEAFWGRRCPRVLAGGGSSSVPASLTSSLTPEAIEALLPTLPTTLPSVPGKLWNNGGILAVS
ncbi:hypothetical protein [Methylobacterium oxalidis]|uniref:Uncharacterized protein n=1 Tax=Methylobacterium oxalidis TaxID=944322 RepID=A0A512J2A2_9HYPH|nr:hypothetical protein [Methylobacterium oxalidis]GEP04033.1 hypothetical protein MOX02_20710 [Methylobacterium oxalidis]GJE34842.1 hypothetical protein LDDCCGHA_5057 [Methylobacterium oxalidis]GLS64064.1 hypothetical protein GCM10007888_24450 [Methylobacterium oxalidis]